MPHPTKSFRLASAVFFSATFLAHVAHAENTAQEYPAKPVRFIVPSPAGGAADNISRAIARKLSETWRQQVVVDNRAGAAGAIALDLAAKAPADGYTMLLLSASHTIDAAVNAKTSYSLTKDFAAVSQASSHFPTLYHHPTIKLGSVSELIAHAKANPGRLAFGSAGTGSIQHLAWELFAHMAGVKLMHVPYKGGAHAMTAALTGEVQIGFTSLMTVRPHVPAGRLRVLAITAKSRSPIAPELPTVSEAGVPGFEADQWYGVVTRAGVPPAVLRKLNAGILEAVKSPDLVQRFTVEGVTPLASTPQEFTALIKSDATKWRNLIADARLTLN